MSNGFRGLGISPEVLDVISTLGFTEPTPIQRQAIPVATQGKDVLGIAQTGTGKTLAFGIPMVGRLLAAPGRSLVLVPTRELALQVDAVLRKLGNPFDIRSVIVIGGMDFDTQVKLLRKESIRVIIATPGRLLEHLEKKTLDAADLQMAVLDEADRMLDMGFAPQIRRIAPYLAHGRQTMLFSATIPEPVRQIAALYMTDPERVEAAPSGAAPEKIAQELYIVRPDAKMALLEKLMRDFRGSVLVFTRTKGQVKRLAEALRLMGHTANELHSDRTQGQRRHALEGFKKGLYRVLVATDIAARGIDVKGIELVVNFDLPDEIENYVHRIGRTGRAGRTGHAISFAAPGEGGTVRAIEALMRARIKIKNVPGLTAENFSKASLASKKEVVYPDTERHKTGRPQFRDGAGHKKTPGAFRSRGKF